MNRTVDGICYEYIDPTGNITALVTGYKEGMTREEAAKRVLEAEPSCEQVGFTEKPEDSDIKICMAADEFCGNAVMSAAAFHADKCALPEGSRRSVTVRCSGCEKTVLVDITRNANEGSLHSYSGTVDMPVPGSVEECVFSAQDTELKLPVAVFEGIIHVIAGEHLSDLPDDEKEKLIVKWADELGTDCIGIMFTGPEEKRSCEDGMRVFDISMRPLVYVRSPGTCFWENSCASGTTALSAYYRMKEGVPVRLRVFQPGGMLETTAGSDGRILLSGHVRL